MAGSVRISRPAAERGAETIANDGCRDSLEGEAATGQPTGEDEGHIDARVKSPCVAPIFLGVKGPRATSLAGAAAGVAPIHRWHWFFFASGGHH